MSASSIVTLTISAFEHPHAFRIASTFTKVCRVCASRPSSSLPVSEFRPVCAVTKMRSPVRIACEYVPIAGAAAFVMMRILLGIGRLLIHSFRAQRDFEMYLYWTTGEWREIEKLWLLGMNDLDHNHV